MPDTVWKKPEGPEKPSAYCSDTARKWLEDPIGTAPRHPRYILLEVPLPWTRQIQDSPHIPPGWNDLLKKYSEDGTPFRFLAFYAEESRSPRGYRRMFYFFRPDGPLAFFEKKEYVVPEGMLLPLAEALLRSPEPSGAELDKTFGSFERTHPNIRELFVCTHGVRDACCGQRGIPVYRKLADRMVPASNGRLRVWRTSHIGGHRLAPTLIDFPEGRYWAYMDEEHLEGLVWRDRPFADLAFHYRGWGAVSVYEQVAEREILKRVGWEWLPYLKTSQVTSENERGAEVRFSYLSPERGKRGTFLVRVEKTGTVEIAGCGASPSARDQYAVRDLKPVSENQSDMALLQTSDRKRTSG